MTGSGAHEAALASLRAQCRREGLYELPTPEEPRYPGRELLVNAAGAAAQGPGTAAAVALTGDGASCFPQRQGGPGDSGGSLGKVPAALATAGEAVHLQDASMHDRDEGILKSYPPSPPRRLAASPPRSGGRHASGGRGSGGPRSSVAADARLVRMPPVSALQGRPSDFEPSPASHSCVIAVLIVPLWEPLEHMASQPVVSQVPVERQSQFTAHFVACRRVLGLPLPHRPLLSAFLDDMIAAAQPRVTQPLHCGLRLSGSTIAASSRPPNHLGEFI